MQRDLSVKGSEVVAAEQDEPAKANTKEVTVDQELKFKGKDFKSGDKLRVTDGQIAVLKAMSVKLK